MPGPSAKTLSYAQSLRSFALTINYDIGFVRSASTVNYIIVTVLSAKTLKYFSMFVLSAMTSCHATNIPFYAFPLCSRRLRLFGSRHPITQPVNFSVHARYKPYRSAPIASLAYRLTSPGPTPYSSSPKLQSFTASRQTTCCESSVVAQLV